MSKICLYALQKSLQEQRDSKSAFELRMWKNSKIYMHILRTEIQTERILKPPY